MSSATPSGLNSVLNSEFGEMRNIVVRAGAGAGKTTELVKRVLSLGWYAKERTGQFPALMVTTFTRKATQELRERLLAEAMTVQKSELVSFVQSSSHLHISTIHGILSHFLRRYGQVLGLRPDFTLVDTGDEETQIKKILRQAPKNNPEMARALEELLEHVSFPHLLAALSEYSDERRSRGELKRYIRRDFEEKRCQWMDQLMTGAQLLRKRLSVEAGELSESWQKYQQELETFEKIFKNLSLAMKNAEPATVWREQLQQWYENLSSPRASKKTSSELVEEKKKFSEAIDQWLSFELSDDFFDLHENLSQHFSVLAESVSQNLLEYKTSQGLLTMGDLESLSLELLRQSPEVGRQFASEWDYWLIDEYQDTSPRQVELIRLLTQSQPCFVVGDPQQSIYLFRGADPQVFSEREHEIRKDSKGELRELQSNYRSHPKLLNFFNFFFAKLSGSFQPMIAARPPEKNKVTAETDAEALFWDLTSAENKETEVAAALQRCQQLLARGAKPEEICILSRTNDLLQAIADQAQRNGLPVQMHSSTAFERRREIQDALALLKFLVNPHDNVNLINLLRSPWYTITDSELASLTEMTGPSYWLRLRTANPAVFSKVSITTIKHLQSALEKSSSQGVSAIWMSELRRSGLLDFSAFIDPSGRREANLWKLVQQLKMQERQPGFNFGSFLEKSQLDPDQESGLQDAIPVIEPKRVNLMTVHASKGLQFDHVIVVGVGRWRSHSDTRALMLNRQGHWTLSLSDPEAGTLTASIFAQDWIAERKRQELQEYDRVLYVALTRAKESVALLWSKVEKNSWAERMWKPVEEGFIQEQFSDVQFKIEKRASEPEIKNLEKTVKQNLVTELMPALQFKMNAPSAVSVTALVEKKQADSKENGAVADRTEIAAVIPALEKAQWGTEVHRWFEVLKYHPQPQVPQALREPMNWLLQFQEGLIPAVIRRGKVEDGFVIRHKDRWVQGQIDLWGRDTEGRAYVIDYKTGAEKFKDKALKQLAIYAWALRRMGRLREDEAVNLLVVYPFSKTHALAQAPSMSELELEIFEG